MFFKKKDKFEYKAFMDGTVIDLANVNDPVFSGKMMGDGLAIEPTGNVVVAPCSGTVTVVFPTKHAYGFKQDNGVEVLLHLGIDTVELEGKGFESFVNVGDKITAGDKVATMDLDYIRSQGKPTTSMMIFTSGEQVELLKENQTVKYNDTEFFKLI